MTRPLLSLHPCMDARLWLASPDGPTTMREAWDTCERGTWLAWLVGRAHSRGTLTRQRLVACCLRLVEPVCHLLPDESIADLGIVAQWTIGEATIDEVRAARDRLWERRWSDADADADAAAADVVRASITLDEVCAALDLDPDERMVKA